MKVNEFNEIVDKEIESIRNVLVTKQKEYVLNSEGDRLEHFKRTASFLNCSQKEALLSMLAKHLISISDMCLDSNTHSIEKWHEKITDSINYLFLLWAIVNEEKQNEKHSN